MNLKTAFPNEESVRNHIAENLDGLVAAVKDIAGPLETEFAEKSKRRARGQYLFGAGFMLALIAILAVDFAVELIPLSLPFFAVGGALMYFGWRRIRGTKEVIKAFHEGINDALYPVVFSVFGLSGQRIAHEEPVTRKRDGSSSETPSWVNDARSREAVSPQGQSVLALLDHSELVTEQLNRVRVDDLAVTKVNGRDLFWAEMDVTAGGHNSGRKIFHGYFVSYDLPRTLEGKTFVSTEGDTLGFGHQSSLNTFNVSGVQPTELEWNDFEGLLHVASNNPVEARYVLTPDFMATVYDWWQGKQGHIRIAFIANRMYLLFPDQGVRVGKTVTRIERQEVAEYLESVTLPLMHVLHLIEDIKR